MGRVIQTHTNTTLAAETSDTVTCGMPSCNPVIDDRDAVKKNALDVAEYTPMTYVDAGTNAASVLYTVTTRPP